MVRQANGHVAIKVGRLGPKERLLELFSMVPLSLAERFERRDISLLPALMLWLMMKFTIMITGVESATRIDANIETVSWAISAWLAFMAIPLMFNAYRAKHCSGILWNLVAILSFFLSAFLLAPLTRTLLLVLGPSCVFHASSIPEPELFGRYSACTVHLNATPYFSETEPELTYYTRFGNFEVTQQMPYLIQCCKLYIPVIFWLDVHALSILLFIIIGSFKLWHLRYLPEAVGACVFADLLLADQFVMCCFRVIKASNIPCVRSLIFTRRRRHYAIRAKAASMIQDAISPIWSFVSTDELVRLHPFTATNIRRQWKSAFDRVLSSRGPFVCTLHHNFPKSYGCTVDSKVSKVQAFDTPQLFQSSPLYSLVSELHLSISTETDKRIVDWSNIDVYLRLPALSSLTLHATTWGSETTIMQQCLTIARGNSTGNQLLDSAEFADKLWSLLRHLTGFTLTTPYADASLPRITALMRRMRQLKTLKTTLHRFSLLIDTPAAGALCRHALGGLRKLTLLECATDELNVPTTELLYFIGAHCPLLNELSIVMAPADNSGHHPLAAAYFACFRALLHLRTLYLRMRPGAYVVSSEEPAIATVRSLCIQDAAGMPGSLLRKLVSLFNGVQSLELHLPSFYDILPDISFIAGGGASPNFRDLTLSSGPSHRAESFASPTELLQLVQSLDCAGKLDLSFAIPPVYFTAAGELVGLFQVIQESRIRQLIVCGALNAGELPRLKAHLRNGFGWTGARDERLTTSPETQDKIFGRRKTAHTNFQLVGRQTAAAYIDERCCIRICQPLFWML